MSATAATVPVRVDGASVVAPAQRSLSELSQALLRALADDGRPLAVGYALVDALARSCGARRVSLARSSAPHKGVQLVAMSGQSRLDRRRHLARRIETRLQRLRSDPMQPSGEGCELSGATLALLVTDAEGMATALLLERSAAHPFTPAEARVLQAIVRDPIRLMHRLQRVQASWWPPRYALHERLQRRRVGVAVAVLASVFMLAMPIPAVVKARAAIEPRDRQVVSSPEAGHLLSAHARAGDRVARGQLLARLDDREASRALEGWRVAAARNDEELARALALRDRSSLGELRAEAARLAVEIDMAERSIERAQLTAPFDGVVLAGDPGHRLGAPVDSGEALFEIAAIDDYRLMLDIDERDVRLVEAGQLARVRMAGLPDRVWSAALQPVLPVAVAEPGRNAFRMPAVLEGELGDLRPGMEGVARIRIGSTVPLAALTRGLRERLLLLAWRFGLVR